MCVLIIVSQAGLVDALSGKGPLTVFAPTNDAFKAALKALGITAEQLLAHPKLGEILKYHVVSGKVMSTQLKDGMEAATLEGGKVRCSTISANAVGIRNLTATISRKSKTLYQPDLDVESLYA